MRLQNGAAGFAAMVMAVMAMGSAQAGGFSQQSADTDILYEDGRVVLRSGLTYVAPSRSYDTIAGRPASDGNVTADYWLPSLAIKLAIGDALACAATYTQPFGVAMNEGSQARQAQILAGRNASFSSRFDSDEYAATCAVHLDLGPGRAYMIGGVFLQGLEYEEQSLFGTLRLKDEEAYGYRLGAAYEIPDYAFRGQILYRSAVNHEGDGTFGLSPFAAARYRMPVGTSVYSYGAGTLPQSLELSLRSGIAENWLAFGSVKWTDWSVLPSLDYVVSGIGRQRKIFNFRDGWTVQGGIAHAFTEEVSGLFSLTWDKGVGTGADVMADSWTLGAGAQFKTQIGTFRLGAGATYVTGATQSVARGANFDATAGGEWSFAMTSSYAIKF